MSGHYATLLRGTVEAFLPTHGRLHYGLDRRAGWFRSRSGPFDLDDYVDYVIDILHFLGEDTHVVAVCQPSVPVMAAVALMEAQKDPLVPRSMILMGGPIDTRMHPTAVNDLAKERGIDWFRSHVITKVPFPHPGVMRDVYPGFLQLNGFVSMNLDRHLDAHHELFRHLVDGDGESAQKHREFYDEYLAVMDLTAEFYLQTVVCGVRTSRAPEGRVDAPRYARRSQGDHARRADDRGRRERRHLGRRSDRSGASLVPQHFRKIAKCIISHRVSGTTACSTDRASAPRSRRASPISSRRSMRCTRGAKRCQPWPISNCVALACTARRPF